jgi:drug/metabolite transporter (DMT)-like permease
VVTVLLARRLLGERVQRSQDAGVLLVLAGVVLITAGG